METAPRNAPLLRSAAAGWLLLAFLGQAGCAHRPAVPPGPDRDRAETVGLVSAGFQPEVVLDLPGKGRVDGAIRGAGRGFLAWSGVALRIGAEALRGCTGEACGYVAIGMLAVVAATGTVGAVVGGLEGAVKSMPAAEARGIEEATRYLADLGIQETVRDRALAEAADLCGNPVLAVPDAGPAASDCVVDYRGLAAEGIDSVVEVAVLSVGFQGRQWGSRPPLSAFLNVRVRRYRTEDGTMVEEKEFPYRSGERLFSEWMADGAALLEEEFEAGYGDLAERIAVETVCPPVAEPPAD
jgi:hypothetical protein